jgi:nucleoside 2-deoxyribosyltransferase
MNIYFACSITGGREFESVYQVITEALLEDCHEVPTAHLAETGVTQVEAVITPSEVYARDVAWIRACDVLIAEVSVPSHGVGYEIGFALGLGKPVLALYQNGRKVSKMISGNPDPGLLVKSYQNSEDAARITQTFLASPFIREKRH